MYEYKFTVLVQVVQYLRLVEVTFKMIMIG